MSRPFQLLFVLLVPVPNLTVKAATFESENFIVTADTKENAKRIAGWAEYYRKEQAKRWNGKELPSWNPKARLRVESGRHARGWTKHEFGPQGMFFTITASEGTYQEMVENTLPHEINHAVTISILGGSLPRWLSEGVAMLEESEATLNRCTLRLQNIVHDGKHFNMRDLTLMREYPSSKEETTIFYDQSYSVVNFLFEKEGRGKLIQLAKEWNRHSAEKALEKVYGYKSFLELEKEWYATIQEPTIPAPPEQPRGSIWAVRSQSPQNQAGSVEAETLPQKGD